MSIYHVGRWRRSLSNSPKNLTCCQCSTNNITQAMNNWMSRAESDFESVFQVTQTSSSTLHTPVALHHSPITPKDSDDDGGVDDDDDDDDDTLTLCDENLSECDDLLLENLETDIEDAS